MKRIRLRKNGEKMTITKKEPIDLADKSRQEEQTISLREYEFNELLKLGGKKLSKTRYYYPFEGRIIEIDVYGGPLGGLAVADAEFETKEEMDSFTMPGFCLAEVTHELFIAAGMLCGKSYEEIEQELTRFGYSKLIIDR